MNLMVLSTMTAFQLTCLGNVTIVNTSGLETKEFETVLQVNKSQETWCRKDCEYVQRIYAILDDNIVFRNVENEKGVVDPEDRTMWFMHYKPSSRKYFELNISSGGSAILHEGICEVGHYQP